MASRKEIYSGPAETLQADPRVLMMVAKPENCERRTARAVADSKFYSDASEESTGLAFLFFCPSKHEGCSENESSGCGVNADVDAQAPESPDMVPDPTLSMTLFDRTSAFLIGQSGGEDMIDEHEKVMSNGDDGPLLAFGGETPKFIFEIAVLAFPPVVRLASTRCVNDRSSMLLITPLHN